MNESIFNPNSPAVLLATLKAEQENQSKQLARLEAGQASVEASISSAVERLEKSTGGRIAALEEKVSKLEHWKGWVAGATVTAVFLWEGLKNALLGGLGGGNHP